MFSLYSQHLEILHTLPLKQTFASNHAKPFYSFYNSHNLSLGQLRSNISSTVSQTYQSKKETLLCCLPKIQYKKLALFPGNKRIGEICKSSRYIIDKQSASDEYNNNVSLSLNNFAIKFLVQFSFLETKELAKEYVFLLLNRQFE